MFKQIHSLIFALLITWSCNVDQVITEPTAPTVPTVTPETGQPAPKIPYVSVMGIDKPVVLELGDTVTFIATVTETGLETKYSWNLDRKWVSNSLEYRYIPKEIGEHDIQFSAKNIDGADTINFIVTVTTPKDMYKRQKSELSKADWDRVYEYTPAPGQFINETKTAGYTGEERNYTDAIEYAERRMREDKYVSLGGFGGYIIVGFDHSIENIEGYDLGIKGNSFDGSSEPGVVWVMQDENGDGMPNDTWYELKGSETGKPNTIQNYSVTYFKPAEPGKPVQWEDNLGNSGEVDYLKQYHSQEYYYPAWIQSESYTLTGTRLEPRNYDKSGNGTLWILPHYDWGYADNFSSIDRLSDEDNFNAATNANHFDIANAIDNSGNPVQLEFVDFIKVQCALNIKCGWIGETSTEVFGFFDYSMTQNEI